MEYKITLRNQFTALGFSIIVIIGIMAFVIYQNSRNNFDNNLRNAVFVFSLISLLPVLYLHMEYYCYNRKVILRIDVFSKKLSYIHRSRTAEVFGFEDLDKIILYMAPSWHRGSSFQLLPFEQYHYARIHTKSGKELIITCLMTKRIQDAIGNIRGVTVEKKKRIFASVLIENLLN